MKITLLAILAGIFNFANLVSCSIHEEIQDSTSNQPVICFIKITEKIYKSNKVVTQKTIDLDIKLMEKYNNWEIDYVPTIYENETYVGGSCDIILNDKIFDQEYFSYVHISEDEYKNALKESQADVETLQE